MLDTYSGGYSPRASSSRGWGWIDEVPAAANPLPEAVATPNPDGGKNPVSPALSGVITLPITSWLSFLSREDL